MPESIRSFLAVDLESDIVLRRLTTLQSLLVKTGADLKLVKPQNMHITIRFLGNIIPTMTEEIYSIMKKIQFKPFTAHIVSLGAFPNPNYARVIWAGIYQGAEQLKFIFNQLEPLLQGLGFTPDPKGFSPHLTIARIRSARNKVQLAKFITENANYEFGTIKVQTLRLKKSDITPSGPIYSTIREFCPQP